MSSMPLKRGQVGSSSLSIQSLTGKLEPAIPDTLCWSNPSADFGWITEDNTTMQMSASAVLALFQAGVEFKSALTFFARDLKDAVIAAADPSSIDIEAGWPV